MSNTNPTITRLTTKEDFTAYRHNSFLAYGGIFTQRMSCGARETAIAR
jgi:hypothetical protein